MKHPKPTWMMYRGTPQFQETSIWIMMNRLLQERLYGTLEKSSGCCLVRHNEVLALKAEAGERWGWWSWDGLPMTFSQEHSKNNIKQRFFQGGYTKGSHF
jgi:hypothetical protein